MPAATAWGLRSTSTLARVGPRTLRLGPLAHRPEVQIAPLNRAARPRASRRQRRRLAPARQPQHLDRAAVGLVGLVWGALAWAVRKRIRSDLLL